MTNAGWFLLIGALLLLLGLTRPIIAKIPTTSAMIYLIVGMTVGPIGFELFHFNPLKESALLEILTEVAVLISLFAAGVKMPVPFSFHRWRTPLLLAFASMALTVSAMAAFAYYALDFPLGAAVLLAAIVAPTDPVLATDVQTRHPGDNDQLRFSLTSEAGMNDGTAFPFVMLGLGLLGLHELGEYGARWLLVDVVWATGAGIALGVVAGITLATIASRLRKGRAEGALLDDFLGLGLIAGVYGLSLVIHAWGFLAVFAAAVALRQTELKLAGVGGAPAQLDDDELPQQALAASVSQASLVFKEHLERLSEVVLILLVGGMLFIDSWSWRAVAFTGVLFFVVRPLGVFLGTLGAGTPLKVRVLCGWFGVRGIGSLYYLMYAVGHGLPEEIGLQMIHITLVVVTLSIIIHGITVKPVINRYGKSD